MAALSSPSAPSSRTASTPLAMIPVASPRQPAWSIATDRPPPTPATAIGRQSAVSAHSATSARSVA